MYGAGDVWVKALNGSTYRVFSVNVGEYDPKTAPSQDKPEKLLECITSKHKVIVEDIGRQKLRYRSWDAGKIETSTPDLQLENGDLLNDGHGICAYSIYRFRRGKYVYEVSSLGCTDGSEPRGSKGKLTVRRGEQIKGEWWCNK